MLGYELTLEQETATKDTDTTFLGAVGGRGLLLAAAETGGFQLATRTDAMFPRRRSLAAADAEAPLRVVRLAGPHVGGRPEPDAIGRGRAAT